MRKEMTTDVIDKIDNNNMKALEMAFDAVEALM